MTPTEAALATLWQELLGMDDALGPDDDFFLLGGDSLLALSLMAEIEDRFGAWMEASVLLQASTLAGMATEIESARDQSS